MIFKGLQKVSVIEYPQKICAVVFTGGCNFRCHYCHNPELVLNYKELPDITDIDILSFLKGRKGLLDAVCIGGGEPTLHNRLPDFIRKVKGMGFLVKIDTNGTNPDMLIELLDNGLVDYIAMDIKAAPDKYFKVVDVEVDISKISKSIKIIMQSGINYEFRTTVFPEFFTKEDGETIREWVRGAKKYVIQQPRVVKMLDERLKGSQLYSKAEIMELASLFSNCIVRW